MIFNFSPGRAPGAVCAGAALLLVAAGVQAAAVVQPDVRVGVVYLDNGGFTGEDDVSSGGAEIQAKLSLGWVDERGSVTIMPMIRATKYQEDDITEREEQRIIFNWFRNFQTAASNTMFGFDRQDLFSSEFRDISLDPDEVPIDDTTDTGIVNSDSTRNQVHFRQDFAKGLGQRDNLLFAAQYRDISYDDSAAFSRIDFNEVRLGAGWRRTLSERTDVLLIASGRQYDGDNGVTVDSVGGRVGFDINTSETTLLSILAGYENSDAESQGQDLGSDGQFVFTVGAEKTAEITRYGADLTRRVVPTGNGGVSTESGLSVYLDRQLSERTRFSVGLAAFQQERSLAAGNDRDYLTGKLQYAWQISRQWALEAQFRHVRQDFESPPGLAGGTTEDRNRVFLNLRYRGLNEVRVPRDRRFLPGDF